VTGTARISLIGQRQYYGDFAVDGTANGSAFDFTELRITAQVPPPLRFELVPQARHADAAGVVVRHYQATAAQPAGARRGTSFLTCG